MNKTKILGYYIAPLIVILITAALLHSNLNKIESSPAMIKAPWAVGTGLVTSGVVNKGFPALGKVVSSTEVRIVPKISGTVLKMGPRAGGMVNKGDLIVQLDTQELEAMAASLEEKLASAIAVERNSLVELKRLQKLLPEGAISVATVDQAQTTYTANQASVRSLKQQLKSQRVKISYGHIVAPLSARVADRDAEPGDTVFPGKPVYTLTAVEGGRVIVPVPLTTLTRIQAGSKVILSLGDRRQETVITRTNPSLDELSMGSFEVDLPARPFDLPNDAPISARVITAEAGPALSVSIDALRPAEQTESRVLFKIVNDSDPHLKLTNVHVQLCGEARCIVDGDLHEGDRIVVAHSSVLLELHDGDPVLDSWSQAR